MEALDFQRQVAFLTMPSWKLSHKNIYFLYEWALYIGLMHSTNAYPREAATKKHSKFTRPRNENVNATFCFKCTSTISGKFATLRMGKFSAESGRACSHTARCRALPLMPCRGISRCCATTRDVARQRAIMRDARCRATTRGKVTLKSNQVQLQTVTLR